jgi:hypothetical protein
MRDSSKRRRRNILFKMEEEGEACMALAYLPLLAPGVYVVTIRPCRGKSP